MFSKDGRREGGDGAGEEGGEVEEGEEDNYPNVMDGRPPTPSLLLSLRHYRIPSYASEAEFKHLYPANPASCDRIFIRVTVISPKTKAGRESERGRPR